MLKRIRFLSSGYSGVLNSPGTASKVAAEARRQAQAMEREAGSPYRVQPLARATSRIVYVAKPEDSDEGDGRAKGLDHDTWVNEVWPKVGGPKWRPHR